MIREAHLGDVGLAFYAIVKDESDGYVDLTSAGPMTMKFQKPNKTVVEQTATRVTAYTGTNAAVIAGVAANAVMSYVTTSPNDLNMRGTWWVQGKVVIGSGTWHTDEYLFEVHRALVTTV